MLSFLLCFLFEGIAKLATRWEEYTLGGSMGPVKYLPFGLILKLGNINGVEEAKIIRFVQRHTQIPVPRVLLSARGLGRNYMLMTRVEGHVLQFAWYRLSPDQQSHVVQQLQSIVAQLRSIPPSRPSVVSALDGRPCLDARVAGSRNFGPFADESSFNDYLIQAALPFMDETRLPTIRAQMSDKHRIVFTHGDLTPRNILVKGDRVVAVLDWEHAGWYPEHWEYVKAWYSHMMDESSGWTGVIKDIVPGGYEKERLLDKQLSDRMVGGY